VLKGKNKEIFMSHNWFYADAQNQQQGPVADAWLVGAYQRGELNAGTLLWREGLAAWTPLSGVAAELGLPIAVSSPPPMSGKPVRGVAARPSSSSTWVVVTVVIIFGVLFVGGILAAIALPAYQDYTQRAKVAGALVLANSLKVDAEEFFNREGRCPKNTDGAFKAANSYATPVISAINIGVVDDKCAVQVLFKDLGRGTEGKELLLTMDAKGRWHTTSNLPDRYLPMSLRQSRAR
jgi:type IV pilus assembly protein PilA